MTKPLDLATLLPSLAKTYKELEARGVEPWANVKFRAGFRVLMENADAVAGILSQHDELVTASREVIAVIDDYTIDGPDDDPLFCAKVSLLLAINPPSPVAGESAEESNVISS